MKLSRIAVIAVLWGNFLAAGASGAPIVCNTLFPYAAGEPPLKCEPFTTTGFPKNLGGAEHRIYHYADGWTGETGQLELLAAVSEAMELAVPTYAQSAAVPRIYFVLYNEFSGSYFAEADWQLSTTGHPCRVRLYLDIPMDREWAKQIAAHEAFHCVQRHGIVPVQSEEANGKLLSARWWIEGSANFFSSLAIPSGNGELPSIANYKTSIPLFRQPNSYSTALVFYSFMMSGLSPHAIVNLLKQQPQFSTFAAERRAFASEKTGKLFLDFAKNLADKKITGVAGKKLPAPELSAGDAFPIGSDTKQMGFSVVPFTMLRAKLHFKAGQKRQLVLGNDATSGKVLVAYRKAGENWWLPMEPGRPVPIDVPCPLEKGEEWEFVYTSWADSDDSQPFTMKMEGEDKECRCADSAAPVDACHLGNWKLNNAKWAAWVHANLAKGYESVEATGVNQFHFKKQHEADQTLSTFRTVLNIKGETGLLPWIVTESTGTVLHKLIQQKPGKMCLRYQQATGTQTYAVGGHGKTGPLQGVFGAGGEDARLNYVCTPTSLMMYLPVSTELTMEWHYDKQ